MAFREKKLDLNNEQVFIGYRVVHEVRAEISDIYMVGSIIDDAVKAGTNTVSDIKFSISEPQKYYKIALTWLARSPSPLSHIAHVSESEGGG
jgi:uncharacterized protein YggE